MNILSYFKLNFPGKAILFTNSGRAALQAVIEDFKLKNSKMILPAFICRDVFSTLFKQNNIKPVFIDCPKNDFNITLKDIKKHYNKEKNKNQIKSILIVHTFGEINKDIKKITEFCQEEKLILIEDCAHILKLKITGDAAIFSFNKVTNIPIGGCYLKNKGKIKVKALSYKINNLDVYRILNSNNFGELIIKILKLFRVKKKINVNPEKIKIFALPNFINFFDFNKKLKIIPILKENRDEIFKKLIKKGVKVEKYWTPIFPGYPNAYNLSKKIINIIKEKSFSPS